MPPGSRRTRRTTTTPEAKVPERDVLRAVLATLRAWGIEPKRRNTGAMLNASGKLVRFGEKGDSDIQTQLPGGRLFLIEVKRPGKRPTPEQYAKLRKCNDQGGVGLWVDDALELARILPKLCGGGRVEIDEAGDQWLVTDDEQGEDIA